MKSTLRQGLSLEVEISGVAADGSGVARIPAEPGWELWVVGGAPGDRLRVRVDHVSHQAQRAFARIVEASERGATFRDPPCRHAIQRKPGHCGGCSLIHLDEAVQRSSKLAATLDALKPFADERLVLEPSLRSWRYRNRASYTLARSRGGRVRLGSFSPRSHRFARMDECHLVREPIRRGAVDLSEMLTRGSWPVGAELAGLSHVTLRASTRGELLVEWAAAAGAEIEWSALSQSTMSCSGVVGVSRTETNRGSNAVRGAESHHLAGEGTVVERVGELDLALSAASFSQLNSDVGAAMYSRAAEWAVELCDGAGPVIWDLYCGVGGLGLTVASELADVGATDGAAEGSAPSVFGAEQSRASVGLAQTNADRASVAAQYDVCDLQVDRPRSWPSPDLILLNPPRKGLASSLVAELIERRVPLIYMSCNAGSLARDLAALLAGGYAMRHLAAFDMLPQTSHVELLVALAPL
ncbi:MAG: 23S rRNA (uracil(1939)-C(5))-methyltransferase RlmD [Myxococcales bacterium]|nr:23S rRNA (uracil(1939)-C(5))-methyltransferase RlmD [Myxococcales bacterium]